MFRLQTVWRASFSLRHYFAKEEVSLLTMKLFFLVSESFERNFSLMKFRHFEKYNGKNSLLIEFKNNTESIVKCTIPGRML